MLSRTADTCLRQEEFEYDSVPLVGPQPQRFVADHEIATINSFHELVLVAYGEHS